MHGSELDALWWILLLFSFDENEFYMLLCLIYSLACPVRNALAT
jgi:hypothetical protein